jgi:hypothetical protein
MTAQAESGFSFDLPLDSIKLEDPTTYLPLVAKYGAEMPPAPQKASIVQSIGGQIVNASMEGSPELGVNTLNFEVKEGYEITSVDLYLELGNIKNNRRFDILGCDDNTWLYPITRDNQPDPNVSAIFPNLQSKGQSFMQGAFGPQVITYVVGNTNKGAANFALNLQLTEDYKQTWKRTVWSSLYNAAQTAYYTNQSKMQAKITALRDKINNVDTLTLRREENEEIMKCTLRWLFGAQFEFVPHKVRDIFKASGHSTNPDGTSTADDDMKYGVNFTGNSFGLDSQGWAIVSQYEAAVNFINEAIEWENVIYFLYSYFWDVPDAWQFVQQINHPDATRQAFLRSGAARVALTVRKGYELAWTWFVNNFDSNPPPGPWPNYPYMTIPEQIQNYDNTNYPGIPPANPAGGTSTSGPNEFGSAGTTCSVLISPKPLSSSDQTVKIPVADSTGFKVGASAVIGSWGTMIPGTTTPSQERQRIVAVPDGKHIVVAQLQNEHNGNADGHGPFSVLQAGEKGVLIAEWFEYTPSHGTDIAINSNLKGVY